MTELNENDLDLHSYDHIIVAMSGGKDSIACALHLMEQGAPMDKVEFWHHDVDGGAETFMDWPCTDEYVRALGKALNVPVLFQYKEGGFLREMTRHNTATAPIYYEKRDGSWGVSGGKGKPNTRMIFPQVSANLSVRWCSAYLKVDVCAAAIRGDERFRNKRTLVVTGERAQESKARSKYKKFERNRSHSQGKRVQRHVDHWRPVHSWPEEEVWAIMERHRINPHPAYHLGFGRVSCMSCIFGGPDQWRTIMHLDPERLHKIANFEHVFGKFHGGDRPKTIHRSLPVLERAHKGKTLVPEHINPAIVKAAMEKEFNLPIIVEEWTLPAGAYRETGGPT